MKVDFQGRIYKNVLGGGASKFLMSAKLFMLTPIFVSSLGKEEFGLYQTLLAVFGFASFISVGLSPNVTFAFSGQKGLNKKCIAFMASTRVMAVLFSFLLLLAFQFKAHTLFEKYFSVNVDFVEFYLCFVITTLTLLFSIGDAVRAGMHQHYLLSYQVSFLSIIQMLIFFIVIKIFGVANLYLLILVNLGGACLCKGLNLIYVLNTERYLLCNDFKPSRSDYLAVFSVGFPFFLMQVSMFVSSQGINLFVAKNLGVGAVTIFQVNNIFLLTFMSLVGLYTTPLSIAMHSLQKEGESLKELWVKAVFRLAALAILAFACVMFVGDIFIQYWVGEEFILSGKSYLAISITLVFTCLYHLSGSFFSAHEKFTALAGCCIIQVVVLLFCMAVWVPRIGVEAVFYSQLVSAAAISFVQVIWVLRSRLY